ncbi:hypothetical protein PIROE2DRAFT_69583 [Piromyces sp. E2]|nr:hypothetical protein PIROE2DRAFT_69583 [Piromyces sp. E2]|eukprot:OUM61655.1 hypothetical protein PIROE2DRAFT_69583 [Piromyces sp. E2]
MDKLIVDSKGKVTISNDGATILKLLDIVHPAGKVLVDIARSQDAEVGDGTTSVSLFAAELLKEVKSYIEEGVSPQVIIKGFRKASQLAINKVKELAVPIEKSNPTEFREILEKCAATALSSKLVHSQKDFFKKMVVDAVLSLDQEELNERMIGIKKIPGGAMQMELSRYLREYSRTIEGKQQLIIAAFAKALEVIPRQIADNAGFDATDILNKLRQKHATDGNQWFGVDINSESISNNYDNFVWEPALVKINILSASTEAANLILSVDETVRNPQSEKPDAAANARARGAMMAARGRGVTRR